MKKRQPETEDNAPKPSFEEAMQRLDLIVKQLETGQVSLEESIRVFEEGVELYRFCSSRLQEVETKIERLVKTEQGFQLELLDEAEIG
ncbi:MAG: exodeoxyribonuclease VII small subunit [candidate division KSB1 bacterium]